MTLNSFPRGGRKPQRNFEVNNVVKKKARSKSRGQKNDLAVDNYEKPQNLVSKSADSLTYTTLTQGMVVLGRVREAREYDIIMSLPGRLIGRLELTDISESYTSLLQNMISAQDKEPDGYKPLPKLFNPGDYLVCYVKKLNLQDKWRVSLSLEPELINQNLDRTRIIKRSKVLGSISSIEEHGYVIDTGVANLRAFLSSKDIDEEKQYCIGQQVLFTIKDVKTSDSASTVTLSAKTKHNSKAVEQDAQLLDALVPGTKLVLTITKILSNGLQVVFNESNIGYINQIYLDKPLSSYKTDSSVNGTLLYILPTVKFAYFSLLSEETESEKLNIGDILTTATVQCREHKGILLRLTKNLRGFIPLRRTEVDIEKIKSTFATGTRHKCRVLNYDWFDRVYICSMQKDVLKQEHFTITSFVPGELLTAEIVKIDIAYGSVSLQTNKVRGYVPPEHVADIGKNVINKLEVGQSVKVRVLRIDNERNRVLFTMKESLINSNLPILTDIKEATVGSQHHGTVVQTNNNGILVQFFGNVKGWVAPQWLGCSKSDVNENFYIGQVVAVTILKTDQKQNKIFLSLATIDIEETTKLRVGETVEGIVTESSPKGLKVNIHSDSEDVIAFLPAGHMSPSLEVASLLAARYTPGDKITATIFSTSQKITLTTTFMPQPESTNFDDLEVGHYLPCSVKEITKGSLKVLLPIDDYKKLGTVPFITTSESKSLCINQMLFGKIISIDKKSKKLELNTKLYDLWLDAVKQNAEMTNAVDVLGLYLSTVNKLSKYDYYASRPISKVSLGQRVTGKIEKVTEDGLILSLENDLQGMVRKDHCTKNLKVGDKVHGAVIWINYIYEIVEVTLKSAVINRISTEQTNLSSIPTGTVLRGEILLITNWFILVVLKGQGKGMLATLPARRHLNDIEPDLRPYFIGSKIKCLVVVDYDEYNLLPICVLSSTLAGRNMNSLETSKIPAQKRRKHEMVEENIPTKKSKLNKKNLSSDIEPTAGTPSNKSRKLNEATPPKDIDPVVGTSSTESQDLTNNKKRQGQTLQDSKCANEPKKKKSKKSKPTTIIEATQEASDKPEEKVVPNNPVIVEESIPECGFYWDTTPMPQELPLEASSDSDDEAEGPQKQKKNKLSAAERREQERQKEREIREREEMLASNQLPNSVDQFDRLTMSSPDSSVIWVQYMAYHLQATEIDKARAVAKRAIKTINFREENEKLNVWQAWLNLESRFGTLETLNEVFQEAVRTNDAFKVYSHMLTLHADANRQSALEKTITTVTGKFKQNPQAWVDSGIALLKMGLKDKSRHIMQRALQSLPAHQHVDLMVKFAQLENRYGDTERAQTLFEKVLSSYPKRVDVWSAYVDALIKSADIPIARQVLERAAAQTLPARKMKTIFKKYIAFEEQHGTAENVANVQQLARSYVENQCQS